MGAMQRSAKTTKLTAAWGELPDWRQDRILKQETNHGDICRRH